MIYRHLISLVLLGISISSLRAQFYAPDTEYHDPVQRFFVVEMARVIGSFENAKSTNAITEIKYEVTTKADKTTVWEIQWLNATGKAMNRAKVEYPGSLLEAGPGFYRTVGAALLLDGWKRRPAKLEKEEVVRKYWKGAEECGLSREESIVKAFAVSARYTAGETAAMPELSGLLAHAALFSITDRLSIDGVLAARAAAWLFLSERSSAETPDDLWAPILFIGGREKAASQLWQKSHPAKLAQGTAPELGWNIWLRRPTSKEVFMFAVEPKNLAMAVPMLMYDSAANESGGLLAEKLSELVTPKELVRLHNMAPLMTRTTIGGGRILEGGWALFQRAAFVSLLAGVNSTETDFKGFANALTKATNVFSRFNELARESEASLIGLSDIAPLMKVCHAEGIGPLKPVAVVTGRDLMNYGWEMTGLEMGARHWFVRYRWGIPDLAEQILKETTGQVEGLMPFFLNEETAKTFNYRESLSRLRLVDGFFQKAGWSANPNADPKNPKEGGRLFVKRAWLRPREMEWQARSLWDAQDLPGIGELLSYYRDNAGSFAAFQALLYFSTLNRESLAQLPQGKEFQEAFAENLNQPGQRYVAAIYERLLHGLDYFERGQKTEELYWKNPDSRLEGRVFRSYAMPMAYKSAKRFYEQSRENLLDPVAVSNELGRDAYIVGYLTKDAKLREEALEDSRSGSGADMEMHAYEDVVRGDFSQLKKDAEEMVERYESEGKRGSSSKLLGFVPLIQALKDPTHPRHEVALHYFDRSANWTTLRWIFIEQFKLSTEDAIQFLGGRETDLYRRTLICYLDKDRGTMLDAINKWGVSHGVNYESILVNNLYERLAKHNQVFDEKDLKPKDAISTSKLLEQKLKGRPKRD
jgi:hypothetical protein